MSYLANQQVLILKEGSNRNRGKDAQRSNISAARIVSEVVKTTLGPRGMDKMLVDSLGDVTVTSDGATVLDELDVQHPAAKMLVEIAKTQDDEVGDGTTSVVVLAGELLKRAELLLDKGLHPTVINAGFKKAAEKARRFHCRHREHSAGEEGRQKPPRHRTDQGRHSGQGSCPPWNAQEDREG